MTESATKKEGKRTLRKTEYCLRPWWGKTEIAVLVNESSKCIQESRRRGKWETIVSVVDWWNLVCIFLKKFLFVKRSMISLPDSFCISGCQERSIGLGIIVAKMLPGDFPIEKRLLITVGTTWSMTKAKRCSTCICNPNPVSSAAVTICVSPRLDSRLLPGSWAIAAIKVLVNYVFARQQWIFSEWCL